jgi:hypothetical protein
MSLTTSAYAYNAWKEADEIACAKELELAKSWEEFDQRTARAPSAELLQEAYRLRALANDKLTLALKALGPERADSRGPGGEHPGA